MKERLLVIAGPTATGKSRCAIKAAQALHGEIISGDSMLVYQGMDIGTAKPSSEELRQAPHHLVDILPPTAGFNVVAFKERAEKLITDISRRGRLPLLVGGTGLYIRALLENYFFNGVDAEKSFRQEMERQAQIHGNTGLHGRLAALDADAARRLHPNDTRRVIRAMEAAARGESVGQSSGGMQYDALVFGLTMPREILYRRIDARVEQMLADGLEEEVKRLLESGVPADCQSMQAIGYRQMVWYLRGELPYAEAVAKLKQATRNFAKRQLTWYRKMPYIRWIELPAEPDYDAVAAAICAAVKNTWRI